MEKPLYLIQFAKAILRCVRYTFIIIYFILIVIFSLLNVVNCYHFTKYWFNCLPKHLAIHLTAYSLSFYLWAYWISKISLLAYSFKGTSPWFSISVTFINFSYSLCYLKASKQHLIKFSVLFFSSLKILQV